MKIRASFLSLFAVFTFVLCPCYAQKKYTPESPEVRAAVEKAVKFLENDDSGGSEHALGSSALLALALLKAERGLGHPKVKRALDQCAKYARALKPGSEEKMYAPAVIAIFLMEADAKRFKPEISRLLDVILRRQLRNGSWDYLHENVGDTSISQYCVLALWEGYNHGFDVDLKDVAEICNWLIRTQDPQGGFSYKARDSGTPGVRVQQNEVRLSLAVAGLSSVYICMDLLGFQQEHVEDSDSELPPDVRLVSVDDSENSKKKKGPAIGLVKPGLLFETVNLGNRWMKRNYRVETDLYHYFYMYGLERYQTFKDKVENRTNLSPDWYNKGVEYLLKNQGKDGSWGFDQIRTCLAVFFLTRSTQKTIGAILMNQGVLKGGKGFQAGTLSSRAGKIVGAPLSRSVSDMLATLNEGDEEELAAMAQSVAKLKFEGDPTERTKHQAMLRGLVSHRLYSARLMAVKTLSKERSFDNVPALIYALSDPDSRVALEARNGLRFISRKVGGFGLPERPKENEVAAATEKWKAWYRSVRPDAKFFN